MTINVTKTIRQLLLMFVSTLVLVSCVEEYWPELDGKYEERIVVDGKITNEAGPYTIKLSSSSSLEIDNTVSISGASIEISDNEGNSETLTETSSGIYQSSETGIQGVVGRLYKISISIGGKTFESEYEELLAPVGIESIRFEEESHIISEISDEEETGYQFYLSSETASSNNFYYYWEVEETYEYHAPYPVEFIYNGSFDENGSLLEYDSPYESFYCWNTNKIYQIFTQSTAFQSQSKVNDFPLHFVTHEDERMRIQYSIMAKQYSISEKAYTYQKNLKDMNSKNSGLYSKQPFQVRGNLYNIDNPDDLMLGYFYTAGITESEHLFTPAAVITKKALDKWERETCFVQAPSGFNYALRYDLIIARSSPNDWPFYLSYVWVLYTEETESYYAKRIMVIRKGFEICVDCKTNGGTTQKPDFWIN